MFIETFETSFFTLYFLVDFSVRFFGGVVEYENLFITPIEVCEVDEIHVYAFLVVRLNTHTIVC